jgi:AcrR family transcriptional regulator
MPKATIETRLADAALKRLAKTGWSDLTLGDVAKAAKIPLAELQSVAGKPALIGLILNRIGGETAAHYRADAASQTRDRIFDVAMTWFDVLAPRKLAVRSLYDGLTRDPLSLLAARGEIVAAASWLLTLAQADTGPVIAVRAMGLAAMLGHALAVWFDDGPDMAKTMARLDGDLRRAESFGRKKKSDS